jgi:hypothetical protein
LSVGLATTLTLVLLNSADSTRPVITAASIRRACFAVFVDKTSQSHRIDRLCKASWVHGLDNQDQWDSMSAADLPDKDTVDAIAGTLSEVRWEQLRSKVSTGQFDEQSQIQSSGFAAGVSAPVLTESGIIADVGNTLYNLGKKQLETAVVLRLSRRVCQADALGPFLTQTCTILGPIDSGSTAALPSVGALRNAVRSDVVRLPANGLTYSLQKQGSHLSPQALDAALVGRYVALYGANIVEQRDPAVALKALWSTSPRVTSIPFSDAQTPAAASLYQVIVFASSLELTDITRATHWGSSVSLEVLYGSKAFVLNMAHNRPFVRPDATPSGAACGGLTSCERVGHFLSLMTDVVNKIQDVRALRDSLGSAGTAEANLRMVTRALTAGLEVMTISVDLGSDATGYGDVQRVLTDLQRIGEDLSSSNYAAATLDALTALDSLGLKSSLPPSTERVFTLAADLAGAKDEASVDKALEQFLGGSRSYLTKRVASNGWYVEVNAYVGASGGLERACSGFGGTCSRTSGFAGGYLPIGIEVGHPISAHAVSWAFRSIGLFAQFVDLGAIASWRLSHNDSTIASQPKVGFTQILAPGAHIMLGIRDLPLVIGVGAAVAPQLREFSKGSVTSTRNALRPLSIIGAIDIPVFP